MVIFIMITNMYVFPHVMDHTGMVVVSTGNAEVVEWDGIGASDVWLEIRGIEPGVIFSLLGLVPRRISLTCSSMDPKIPWLLYFFRFMQSGLKRGMPFPNFIVAAL